MNDRCACSVTGRVDGFSVHAVIVSLCRFEHEIETDNYHRVGGIPAHPTSFFGAIDMVASNTEHLI